MWNFTKKITETAQTDNFSDLPLIFSGNGPKSTKTMQMQTHFAQIGNKFWGIQGIPLESWRPGLSENVVVFMLSFLNPGYGWSKLGQSLKKHGYNFAFQAALWIEHGCHMVTLLKFQTLLTLSSHNSGLKDDSTKNHHIFRKPWTSAF